MSLRRTICLASASIVFAGGLYTATPAAAAAAFACSEQEWRLAQARADAACEGPASFYGNCENGRFVIEGVYC